MYIILGIASMGILGKYPLIIYAIFCILIIYMLYKKKFIYPKNKNFYILILFSIMNSFFTYILDSEKFSTFLCLGPLIAYYCGIVICEFCKKDEKYITKCIIAIAIGFFVHSMLNYSINVRSTARNTIDFWNREAISATLQGTMLTMIMSLIFWILFYIKKKYIKVVYLICFVLAFSYLTVIATRTTIIISIIVFIIEMIFDMILNKKLKYQMKIISIVMIFVAIISIGYVNNIGGIQDKVERSNIMQRLNKEETDKSDINRLQAQILGLKSILDNPMGTKNKIGNLNYAHNMWLDIGKDAGVIPFLLLAIYTINSIISLFKILNSAEISNQYKILISSIYIGVYINFMTEPILRGIPFFFVMFTMINGMVDTQYRHLRKEDNNVIVDTYDMMGKSERNK